MPVKRNDIFRDHKERTELSVI